MKKHIKRDLIGLSLVALIFIAGHFITVAQAADTAWPGGPTVPSKSYLRIGAIIGSDHVGGGSWNEEQNGLYVGYKGWAIGQYENSYSEVDGRDKLKSSFITYEVPMHRGDWIETSFTVGVVDGYPEEATTFRRSTLPWISINIRIGGTVGAKLWHVPLSVTAYGIEYRKEVE